MTSVRNDANHHDNNITDGTSDNYYSGHTVDLSGNGEVGDDDSNDGGSGGVEGGSTEEVQYDDDVINVEDVGGCGKDDVMGGNDQEVGNDDGDNEEMGGNDKEEHGAENVGFGNEDDHDADAILIADCSSPSCGQTSATVTGMKNVLKVR